MKSPISRKVVGGVGGSLAFCLNRQPVISDICQWGCWPLCQLGPLALHRGGADLERWATGQQLHGPGTCLQLPVKTSSDDPQLHPMCSPTADLQRTHELQQRFSSVPYIDRFMSCPQALGFLLTILISFREGMTHGICWKCLNVHHE